MSPGGRGMDVFSPGSSSLLSLHFLIFESWVRSLVLNTPQGQKPISWTLRLGSSSSQGQGTNKYSMIHLMDACPQQPMQALEGFSATCVTFLVGRRGRVRLEGTAKHTLGRVEPCSDLLPFATTT